MRWEKSEADFYVVLTLRIAAQKDPTQVSHQRRLFCRGFLIQGLLKAATQRNVVMAQQWSQG